MRWKLSALIAAGMMAMALPVFADVTIDSLSTNTAESSITVSGTTTEDSENVIITVVPSDADISTDTKFFENVAYQNAIKSSNGKYSLTFRMMGADIFTLTASCDDGKATQGFAYGDKDYVVAQIETLNAADAGSVPGLLEANQDAFGLFLDGVGEDPNWAAIGASVAANRPYDTTDVNATVLDLKRQMILRYVTDGVIDNVFDYDEYLDIFGISNNSVFEPMFTDENKQATSELLTGISFKDYSDFSDKIVEKMILAFVQNPDGAANAQDVLVAYEDLIGIDTAGVNVSVYNQIINKQYDNLADLKKRFVEVTATETEDDNAGSDNGLGSGSRPSNRGDRDGSTTIYGPTTSTTSPTPVGESMFYDIDNYAWAKESIEGLAGKGIVSGKAAGYFYPADPVTRSEFVKMLVMALDIDSALVDMDFSDISESDWDYNYVRTAYSAGIINGLGDGRFGGNQLITRQDMAVILHRALENHGTALPGRSNTAFADDAAIAAYAADAAYILREAGVMNGDDMNNFNPTNSATRAEAAKVIYSIIK